MNFEFGSPDVTFFLFDGGHAHAVMNAARQHMNPLFMVAAAAIFFLLIVGSSVPPISSCGFASKM